MVSNDHKDPPVVVVAVALTTEVVTKEVATVVVVEAVTTNKEVAVTTSKDKVDTLKLVVTPATEAVILTPVTSKEVPAVPITSKALLVVNNGPNQL